MMQLFVLNILRADFFIAGHCWAFKFKTKGIAGLKLVTEARFASNTFCLFVFLDSGS